MVKEMLFFLMRIEKGSVQRNLLIRGPKSALVLVRHVDDGFCPENTVTIFYSEDYFSNTCHDSYSNSRCICYFFYVASAADSNLCGSKSLKNPKWVVFL